jgi:hypothetical protein
VRIGSEVQDADLSGQVDYGTLARFWLAASVGQSSYLQIRNDAPVPDPVLTTLLIGNAAYSTRRMGFSTASLTMRRCVRRSWALRRGRGAA